MSVLVHSASKVTHLMNAYLKAKIKSLAQKYILVQTMKNVLTMEKLTNAFVEESILVTHLVLDAEVM